MEEEEERKERGAGLGVTVAGVFVSQVLLVTRL